MEYFPIMVTDCRMLFFLLNVKFIWLHNLKECLHEKHVKGQKESDRRVIRCVYYAIRVNVVNINSYTIAV